MDLSGKTALVTGSGRGIGKEVALTLASSGAKIMLNDIPASDAAEETIHEMRTKGYNVDLYRCDITNFSQVEEMIKETARSFGSLDILVNNAGITKDGLIARMSIDDFDAVINTNLKGTFLCSKAAAKVMMKQKSGKIINMASVVGIMGNAGQTNYAASKAGIIGLTKSLAKELASRNIKCNCVAPGFIQSKMTDSLSDSVRETYLANIPAGRFGTAADVANVVAFLASDLSDYITGQVIHIDGGLLM
ncbi:MAG: 3-oxoacyl-[acyl-carrier-protein] reductase [Clostridiales bacterium]|jgi:3-oxoacyl-[acyl-carrier protein] reductase|nr:3-oxoacyl-[acyl-carrier-protein] reductase [Clostridiales bacterium]